MRTVKETIMHDADDSRLWLAHHKAWANEATAALAELGRSLRAAGRLLPHAGHFCIDQLRRIAVTVSATMIVAGTLVLGAIGPALWA